MQCFILIWILYYTFYCFLYLTLSFLYFYCFLYHTLSLSYLYSFLLHVHCWHYVLTRSTMFLSHFNSNLFFYKFPSRCNYIPVFFGSNFMHFSTSIIFSIISKLHFPITIMLSIIWKVTIYLLYIFVSDLPPLSSGDYIPAQIIQKDPQQIQLFCLDGGSP